MRVPRITIDMLVAVVALAQKRSLPLAGAEIGITSSAVSKRVQAVNKLFGAPLFHRTEAGMALTEEGEVFYADALPAIEQTLLTEERVTARLNLRAGRLLVGHSTYLSPRLLASVLNIRFDESIFIQVEHVSGFTQSVAQRVVEGTLQAGFGYLPVNRPELLTQVLWEEPLVICMPTTHRLAARPSIRPADLADEPVIALARSTLPCLYEEIEGYFAGFGICLRVVADALSPSEAVVLVEQRVGICFLGASGVSRSGVVTRPFEPRILTRKSGIFVRQDNRHPAVKAFFARALETIPGHARNR